MAIIILIQTQKYSGTTIKMIGKVKQCNIWKIYLKCYYVCRCVAKSTEENKQRWYFFSGDKEVFHDIELQCKKDLQLSKCPKESEFLCADKKQCIPMEWKCDKILDCSDGSDECPVLHEVESNINIENDIQSNPKLTVVGIVHIENNLYTDHR